MGGGKGLCCQYSENGRLGALLPGRNVAVVHVSRDHNTYPASVSLKKPRNTKAFTSKAGPPAPEQGGQGLQRGAGSQGESEEGGSRWGVSLKKKKHS